jgi:hypothetical protein
MFIPLSKCSIKKRHLRVEHRTPPCIPFFKGARGERSYLSSDVVGIAEYDFRKMGDARATATPKAITAKISETMAMIRGVLDGFGFSCSILHFRFCSIALK